MRISRDLSGPDLVKALGTLGYTVTRQTGSHLQPLLNLADASPTHASGVARPRCAGRAGDLLKTEAPGTTINRVLPGAPPFVEAEEVLTVRRVAARLAASTLPILVAGALGTGRRTLATAL
jgi:transcriptional regulator of acetoin/glycerol metabolism